MLSLNNVKPTIGSRKTSKRLGRGNGSGKGTTAGRGMNGQNSRSGGGVAPWFEGGQTPLFRRMPKLKGFSNSKFKKEYNIVNLSDLENLASKGITEINKEVLLQNKIIRKKSLEIKLLGKGELKSKLTVVVDKASASAKEAVEKAGGKIELK
ncbi:50S ribosomal protein L15 [Candidatus Gracilibacteria bacterium GN02-872]|nr:50S ribosomal protein L15 [Candidatus Gracilibacteria bacterium GN02-872]